MRSCFVTVGADRSIHAATPTSSRRRQRTFLCTTKQKRHELGRFDQLPTDVGGKCLSFLRIEEMCTLEHTSKTFRLYATHAVKFPRRKVVIFRRKPRQREQSWQQSFHNETALKLKKVANLCPRARAVWCQFEIPHRKSVPNAVTSNNAMPCSRCCDPTCQCAICIPQDDEKEEELHIVREKSRPLPLQCFTSSDTACSSCMQTETALYLTLLSAMPCAKHLTELSVCFNEGDNVGRFQAPQFTALKKLTIDMYVATGLGGKLVERTKDVWGHIPDTHLVLHINAARLFERLNTEMTPTSVLHSWQNLSTMIIRCEVPASALPVSFQKRLLSYLIKSMPQSLSMCMLLMCYLAPATISPEEKSTLLRHMKRSLYEQFPSGKTKTKHIVKPASHAHEERLVAVMAARKKLVIVKFLDSVNAGISIDVHDSHG